MTDWTDVEAVYEALTDGYRESIRVEELVFRAAEACPGRLPTRDQIAAERKLKQSQKAGCELQQGEFLARLLARSRPGGHLIHAMLRPRPESLARLDEFRSTGRADLGLATVERIGAAGHVNLRNPRFLNAEDDGATAALEIGVDLVLLDPACEVGVLRGAVVDHPRYAGRRVFNAGINLTHLYNGLISFVDFMIARELGLVAKIHRGLWLTDDWESGLEDTAEKPWIAAVESFAIGGGCQLLLVVDRVIAERGAYFNLPARKEGIVPGNANQRLARFVGIASPARRSCSSALFRLTSRRRPPSATGSSSASRWTPRSPTTPSSWSARGPPRPPPTGNCSASARSRSTSSDATWPSTRASSPAAFTSPR